MNFDDFIKFLGFCTGAINKMTNSRYWSLWFLAFLVVLSFFINSIKWIWL